MYPESLSQPPAVSPHVQHVGSPTTASRVLSETYSLSNTLALQLDSVEDDTDASANGGGAVLPTPLGRVASLYYLQHTTAALIAERFRGRQLTHTEVRALAQI